MHKSKIQRLLQFGAAFSLGLFTNIAVATLPDNPKVVDAEIELGQKGSIIENTLALESRVNALLDAAAQHVQDNGIAGVNDFNRDVRFTDRDLYVFSLSRDGVLLSSGGWSAALIGENVLNLTDEDQRPFFKKILEKAKTADRGSVEYLWFNPADGANDPKITHFRVVDNVIISSGYFPGYSTEEQAKELLDQAVSEYFKDPELAMRKFRNQQSGFRNRDQYVFVLDKANRDIIWSPDLSDLNDKPLDEIKDIQGTAFLNEIVDKASPNIIQEISYWWFSPISQRVELRRAFYQQVGDSVLAVATYVLPTK